MTKRVYRVKSLFCTGKTDGKEGEDRLESMEVRISSLLFYFLPLSTLLVQVTGGCGGKDCYFGNSQDTGS